MKKIFILFILCSSLYIQQAFACFALPHSFCESTKNREFVAKALILNHEYKSIKVKLLKVFIGNESREEIIVWDEKDFECNGHFDMSAKRMGEIGDTIIFAADFINVKKNSWDVIGDFRYLGKDDGLVTFLRVKSDTVYGYISGDPIGPVNKIINKLSLKQFIEKYQECRENGNIEILSNLPYYHSVILNFYPNPATEAIKIELNNEQKIFREIIIKNDLGQSIVDIHLTGSENLIDINLSDISPGVFFIELLSDNHIERRKLIKTH